MEKLQKHFESKGYIVTAVDNSGMLSLICMKTEQPSQTLMAFFFATAEMTKQYVGYYEESAAAFGGVKFKGGCCFYYGTAGGIADFEDLGEIENAISNAGTVKPTGKIETTITLWGKSYDIEADTKRSNDGAYAAFEKIKAEKEKRIEVLMSEHEFYDEESEECVILSVEQMQERFTPRFLLFKKDRCALLLDDEEDPDNGYAVVLAPEEAVMTQDEYL